MRNIKYAPIRFDLENIHEDARGIISRLPFKAVFRDILYITCTEGALRAAHRHSKDYHLSYLVYGSLDYYERPTGGTEKVTKIRIKPGDWFFSASKRDHLMAFLKDSAFIAFSHLERDQKSYENDTTKLDYDMRNFV